jgi:hypothetical protein
MRTKHTALSHERKNACAMPKRSRVEDPSFPHVDTTYFSCRPGPSSILVQKFLGLVDFTGQVGASASVGMVRKHQSSVVFSDLVFGERPLAEVEDQRRFLLVHPLFKAAFVEWPPQGVEPVGIAPATEGDETGATLQSETCQSSRKKTMQKTKTYEESCGGDAYANCDG